MKYEDFERIMSQPRIGRYLHASDNNTKRAMTLYRKNLELSQELFTLISCLKITLRNKIDQHYVPLLGADWLRDSITTKFSPTQCINTRRIISKAVSDIAHHYAHNKLLAKMDFGFWRYLFAGPQYFSAGATLLHIFPARPTSTPAVHYNHTFVFDLLGHINNLRNRIAHHEPICFQSMVAIKDTTYARQNHALIKQLFTWMAIEESALLYGLDHVSTICNQIDHTP